jgi:cytochrome c556
VATRQSVFKLLSWNMGPLGGMVRGAAPFDAAVVSNNATNMANLAPMIPALFASDTHEFELETRALDGIWTSKDAFDAKAAELAAAATAVAAAADSGDEAATRAAIGAMGQVCGSCHDNYRAE